MDACPSSLPTDATGGLASLRWGPSAQPRHCTTEEGSLSRLWPATNLASWPHFTLGNHPSVSQAPRPPVVHVDMGFFTSCLNLPGSVGAHCYTATILHPKGGCIAGLGELLLPAFVHSLYDAVSPAGLWPGGCDGCQHGSWSRARASRALSSCHQTTLESPPTAPQDATSPAQMVPAPVARKTCYPLALGSSLGPVPPDIA